MACRLWYPPPDASPLKALGSMNALQRLCFLWRRWIPTQRSSQLQPHRTLLSRKTRQKLSSHSRSSRFCSATNTTLIGADKWATNANSRNRIISEPIFVLSYNYLKNNTRLNIDLGYQFGEIGNTRIAYANAQNPEPNYYRNMPSYYLNQNAGPDFAAAENQKKRHF